MDNAYQYVVKIKFLTTKISVFVRQDLVLLMASVDRFYVEKIKYLMKLNALVFQDIEESMEFVNLNQRFAHQIHYLMAFNVYVYQDSSKSDQDVQAFVLKTDIFQKVDHVFA